MAYVWYRGRQLSAAVPRLMREGISLKWFRLIGYEWRVRNLRWWRNAACLSVLACRGPPGLRFGTRSLGGGGAGPPGSFGSTDFLFSFSIKFLIDTLAI